MSTEDHLKQPGWWPRKGDASRSDYVGPEKCAQCHKSLAASQSRHSMAHTSARAEDSEVLKQSDVEFKTGTYTYRITRKDHQEIYSVTDGTRNFSTPLVWAFGGGRRGQTYIYGQDRHMYESRISFIRGLGFAITPGQPEVVPDLLPDVPFRRQTKSCASDVTQQPRGATAALILPSSCRASPAKAATGLDLLMFRLLNRGAKHPD